MAPKSPVGIELLKGKTPKWRVGKELGSGACATVHLLEEIDGTPTEWAIKLAPVPQKKTKKANSIEEVNDRLLYHESVMYQNQFQDIQGVYVPKLPPFNGPSTSGEKDGYRFLTMEKMHSPLESLVPELLKASKSSSTVTFGAVAVQLLKCVQAIQDHKHVVVDIKPENFMLSNDAGKGAGAVAKLASRIRILDLALVKMWTSIGEHRANDGTSTLEGTPLFASLNVHNGETPSRRDDLEALGYVIAELIMKLVSGNPAMELPWSNGRSDEEIGQVKAAQIDNTNSQFYKQLGSPSIVKIVKEFLDTVRGYSYKKTPDYQQLASLLSKLNVPIKTAQKPKRASKTTPKKTPNTTAPASGASTVSSVAGNKRVTRSRARIQELSSDEESSPHKIARDDHFMETEDVEVITCAQPFAVGLPARDMDDDGMDWEPISDENQDPEPDQKPKALEGVTIVVDSGPETGAAMNLVQGRCETLIVGRKPVAKKGEAAFALTRDGDLDDSHIQIDLAMSKKLKAVVVTDLKSSSGAFVDNKDRIKKTYKIFRGQSVRIGNSVLVVKTLDGGKIATASQQGAAVRTKRAAAPKRSTSPQTEVIEIEDSIPQPALKRRGMRICVVEGPHKGEEFELEFGVSESITIGSKPSGKKGANISLSGDKSLKSNHVQIELLNHKRFKAVVVTDKSQGDLKVNRDRVKKSQAFLSDRIEIGNSVLQVQSL